MSEFCWICFPYAYFCFSQIKSCYISYAAAPKEKSPENYTRYHEVSAENWRFVERLIPPTFVPSYPKNGNYSSDWTPPAGKILLSGNQLCKLDQFNDIWEIYQQYHYDYVFITTLILNYRYTTKLAIFC